MIADDQENQKHGEPVFNGALLRIERRKRGFSLRDVERASRDLAQRQKCPDLVLHRSRVSCIENGSSVPGGAKLAALVSILRLSASDLLRLFSHC